MTLKGQKSGDNLAATTCTLQRTRAYVARAILMRFCCCDQQGGARKGGRHLRGGIREEVKQSGGHMCVAHVRFG